jgi:uncharacterized repeat protein (TIGR03803 family)
MGSGMVWEITTSGVYKDLHDFGGNVIKADGLLNLDGVQPNGNLTFDNAGNIYGTTQLVPAFAGDVAGGTVWEITAAGAFVELHDFGGQVLKANGQFGWDGNYPLSGVTLDNAGNVYGTASDGGTNSGGIVWKITPAGVYTDLHDFGGTVVNADGLSGNDGLQPEDSVTVDGAGNLYGTAYYGGPNVMSNGYGAGMVWEITASGNYIDLHDFGGTLTTSSGTTNDGRKPIGNITFDSAGNMYGTTNTGGPYDPAHTGGSGIVWEITASRDYNDLHDFGGNVVNADGLTGYDGLLPTAGVTLDRVGNLYGTAYNGGANQGLGMVWKLSGVVPAAPTGLTATAS